MKDSYSKTPLDYFSLNEHTRFSSIIFALNQKKGMKSDQLEYGFSVEYMYQFKYGMMRKVSMRVFVGVISVSIVSQPNA